MASLLSDATLVVQCSQFKLLTVLTGNF